MIAAVLIRWDAEGKDDSEVIFHFRFKKIEDLHKAIHVRDLCRSLIPGDRFEVVIQRQDEGGRG